MMLRIAAPAFGRLRSGTNTGSMLGLQMTQAVLPVAANRAAMRRIGRQRGPLTRRVASTSGFSRSAANTWVAWLNQMVHTAPPTPPAPPAMQYVSLPSTTLYTQVLQYTADTPPKPQSFYGAFFVAPEGAPVTAPGTLAQQNRVEAPDFFRSAARKHLAKVGLFPARPVAPDPNATRAPIQGVRNQVLTQMLPRSTDPTKPSALQKLTKAVISTGDSVLKPTALGVVPTGTETVMAPPAFPQPMYESLRDLSQDLLLLGLDKIQPDSVLGLRTNRRFVEAYMVGLNHEMGRELLWRGYPTDQRGTYFDHFWGNGVPNSAPSDITDLNTWSIKDATTGKLRQLGDTVGAPPVAEQFVLVMRSSLLRRYPNAVIYLTPAKKAGPGATNPDALVPGDTVVQPIFSGSMQPDIVFFGFPVSTAAATGSDGTLGYYVIIQEHPTEPRFGFTTEFGFSPSGSHLAVTPSLPQGFVPPGLPSTGWNTNAAGMAQITRRLPVRMAIHAALLITPA
jgi:hypothetical protein